MPEKITLFPPRSARGLLWSAKVLAATLSVVGAPTFAQQESSPDPLEGLSACAQIEVPTDRLACFDREFAVFAEARDSRSIAVVDREEVRQTRRALFGLSLPRLGLFERDGDAAEAENFIGIVKAVSVLKGGRYAVQIDDTVWQTTETGYFQRPPKVGAQATVTRGLLGSYEMSVDGKNALKAVRVR